MRLAPAIGSAKIMRTMRTLISPVMTIAKKAQISVSRRPMTIIEARRLPLAMRSSHRPFGMGLMGNGIRVAVIFSVLIGLATAHTIMVGDVGLIGGIIATVDIMAGRAVFSVAAMADI